MPKPLRRRETLCRPAKLASSENDKRWGKPDTDLAPGGTCTVSLWQTTGGGWEGWEEDSTEDWVDVYAPPVQSSDIAKRTFVLVEVINGRRVVTMAACPTT